MADSAGKYSASLNYLNEITADEITVIFNGTTYTVPKRTRTLPNKDVHSYYGTLGLLDNGDATGEYPFCIYVAQGLNTVYVSTDVYENHNPFTIKIMEESVSTTPCFDKARGYSCGEEVVTLTEESVTTTMEEGDTEAYGELSYSQFIDADSITVTFDGVEYECPRIASGMGNAYGGFSQGGLDFSEYPFMVRSISGLTNNFYTETAGTYSVKIEGMQEIVTTTSCFEKAVQKVAPPTDISPLILTQSGSPAQLDRTFEEISNAYLNGRTVLLDPESASKSYYSMVSLEIDSATGDLQYGGYIVFGGATTQTFSASSGSDYPVLAT